MLQRELKLRAARYRSIFFIAVSITLKVNFFGVLLFTPQPMFAQENSSGEKISVTGKFRLRAFHFRTQSDIVPGVLEGRGAKEVTYQDLFFRSFVKIPVNESLNIFTQLNLYSAMGEGDGGLGKSDLGMQASQAYIDGAFLMGNISAGFFGHSTPGGYILATNGAGIRLDNITLAKDKVNLYYHWIKAYDNSRYSWPDGAGQSNYKDSNIHLLGLKLSLLDKLNFNLYSVYLNDRDQVSSTAEESLRQLYWYGGAASFRHSGLLLNTHAIFNRGGAEINSQKIDVNSYLAAAEAGWTRSGQNSSFGFTAFGKGASGRLSDPLAGQNFLSIRPSHDITNIAVDNSGGLSISGGDLAGLLVTGVKTFVRFEGVEVELGGAQISPFYAASSESYGRELFGAMSGVWSGQIKWFINGGLFLADTKNGPLFGVTGDSGAASGLLELFGGVEVQY